MRKLIEKAVRAGQEAVAAHERRLPDRPATALLCLGAAPADPDRLAAALEARAAGKPGWRALCITDTDTAPAFIAPGRLLESLPTLRDLTRATGGGMTAAERYRRRRLSMMLAKWQVRDCAPLGPEAVALLAPLGDLTEIRALP